MRRRPRSSQGRQNMLEAGSGEGLDQVRRQIVCEMVIAASRGDNDGVHIGATGMAREVPDDGVAGTYLWYLIHHRLLKLLGQNARSRKARTSRALAASRSTRAIAASLGHKRATGQTSSLAAGFVDRL